MPISLVALFVTLPIVGLTLTAVYFIRQTSKPGAETPEQNELAASSSGESGASLGHWRRARRTGYWTSAIILAFVYMLTGVPKVTGLHEVMHRFSAWGYSEDFMLFIGASEFIAGIFLLLPGASKYAAAYLGVIMSGAIYTHLAFDTAIWAMLPLFCLSFLFYIGYEDRVRGTEKSAWKGEKSLGAGGRPDPARAV